MDQLFTAHEYQHKLNVHLIAPDCESDAQITPLLNPIDAIYRVSAGFGFSTTLKIHVEIEVFGNRTMQMYPRLAEG